MPLERPERPFGLGAFEKAQENSNLLLFQNHTRFILLIPMATILFLISIQAKSHFSTNSHLPSAPSSTSSQSHSHFRICHSA